MRSLVFVVLCACAGSQAQEPAPASPAAAVAPAPETTVVTDTQVEAIEPIAFVPGATTIEPASIQMLDAVANTLTNNASIKRVVVRAFAADADPSVQAQLAQGRAQLIVDELIARGIDAARLTAEGVAQPPAGQPSSPLFLIVERAP